MRTPSRSRIRPLVLALAAALTACGSTDPQKTVESLDSWTATVHTTDSAVHEGRVPRRYGAQVRDRATAALNDAREQGTQKASPADARAIEEAGRRLQGAVDTLSATVGA